MLSFLGDDELDNARAFTRLTLKSYNHSLDGKERFKILKEFLGSCGKGVYIEPPFFCDFGSTIHLEDDVYMNFNCMFADGAEIRIGARTMLSPSI